MKKPVLYALMALPFMALYILLSSMIRSTAWIWYLTRMFGLLSFFFLFLSVITGELRLLAVVKSDFKLFKYHIPISIFTMVLVVLHFISALFEKYKWGIGLHFSNYLGFSFSDKWLTLLSLGTLGMYLLLLVSLTSMKKSIRSLGFKNWKLIHLLSYLAFVFAYIHSVNLGTDIKTSAISVVVKPLILVCFWLVIALLVVRVLKSLNVFADQAEINLAALFFIVLIIGGVFVSALLFSSDKTATENIDQIAVLSAEILYYEHANALLEEQTKILSDKVDAGQGGTTP